MGYAITLREHVEQMRGLAKKPPRNLQPVVSA